MNSEEVKRIAEILKNDGYVEYGSVISTQTFEKLFKFKWKENDWNFKGPLFMIKSILDSEGYLCSTSDVENGSLYIFEAEEIAHRIDVIFKNTIKRLKKLQDCLINTKTENFDNRSFRKHLHTSNKVSTGLRSMTSSLAKI